MFAVLCISMFSSINDRLLLIMTENDVNPPIKNDPMEKKNLSITPCIFLINENVSGFKIAMKSCHMNMNSNTGRLYSQW